MTRHKSRAHFDGIVGSAQAKPADQLSNQLQQLLIQQIVACQTTGSAAPPTQTFDVHNVKLKNLKAKQRGDRKKKQQNKGKGDKKHTNNVGGGK
jgi:hypothetical protein